MLLRIAPPVLGLRNQYLIEVCVGVVQKPLLSGMLHVLSDDSGQGVSLTASQDPPLLYENLLLMLGDHSKHVRQHGEEELRERKKSSIIA